MLFSIKSYLKNNRYHTIKHGRKLIFCGGFLYVLKKKKDQHTYKAKTFKVDFKMES